MAGVMLPTKPAAPPAGYTRDPRGNLVPIAGSATDVLAQRTRQQSIDDAARERQTALVNQDRAAQEAATQRSIQATTRAQQQEDYDRAAKDALRTRLIGLLDRPELTSTDVSSGVGVPPPVAFSPATFSGSFGATAAPPAAPAPLPSIAPPDTSAAQANAFARAKDQVALQTAGSLASLRSALAGRGGLGGGAEVRGTQNVLTAGQAQLGDVAREQAIQEGNRLTDFAKTGYEGAITQRGQDVTARGQDIQSQESARDAALHAAETGYQGQIQQRGQDVALAGDRLAAARNAATTRNASVTALLGRLY